MNVIPGLPPNLATLPKGCPFAPRCEYVMPQCREEFPPMEKVGEDHYRACFYDAGKLTREKDGIEIGST
jgi:oligopeptide transport system ATP-binding protein